MIDWAGAQAVISLISGKWDLGILAALDNGSKRYNELSRLVGIRHKVLTDTLQRLESTGFISRSVHDGNPPEVRYELTFLAHSLRDPLAVIAHWGKDYQAGLAAAQPSTTPSAPRPPPVRR